MIAYAMAYCCASCNYFSGYYASPDISPSEPESVKATPGGRVRPPRGILHRTISKKLRSGSLVICLRPAAVRVFLPKCWFDAEKCARGIDALKLYRAEYDDKLQALRPRPVHDWTSHAADSFRYLALTLDRKATHSGFYRRIDYPQHGVV